MPAASWPTIWWLAQGVKIVPVWDDVICHQVFIKDAHAVKAAHRRSSLFMGTL
jgi:hypothetical protein